jgi:hypothetical protein
MLSDQEQIVYNLTQLHMPTVRRSYEDVAGQARTESWSYEQYLLELSTLECEIRRQNRISRNLRVSKLPSSKTFDNFDKKRLPAKVATHLNVLAAGSFCPDLKTYWRLVTPAAVKRICCVPLAMR